MAEVDSRRVRQLNQIQPRSGPIVYWMSRDQRINDNWALVFAQQLALSRHQALKVIFALAPKFLEAAWRQYYFMIEGLKEVVDDLASKRISFEILTGDPSTEIVKYCQNKRVGGLVTDFDPLKIKRDWRKKVTQGLKIEFWEVDAHNIVPCWVASQKQEYAAYTLRPKINRLLPEFLKSVPRLKSMDQSLSQGENIDWDKVVALFKIDRSVGPIDWLCPGGKAGRKVLREFLNHGLARYAKDRNDPTKKGQSNLSPYFHFGQISAQKVALEILKTRSRSKDDFLEELIIRRELAENYCYYNQNYDEFAGAPDWARKTLRAHQDDPQEYLYSRAELEKAETHDRLWNAAQVEMVKKGKMAGYTRMYWAKKILEWSDNARTAFQTAIFLNDKYELDGRDPNGYAGIAWSIAGAHDRPWPERPIFGNVRYMSYEGCRRKFNVEKYIKIIQQL